jgi:ankyrin repeat protein
MLIILNGPLTITQTDADAQFLHAVEKGDLKAAQAALENGADVNAKDNISQTALIACARSGNKDILALLLKKGANVNAKMRIVDSDNWNSNLASADSEYEKHVGTLEEMAVTNKDDGIRNMLDTNGRVALMEAAEKGHVEIAQMLLDHGAAVDEKTDNGTTALMITTMLGHKKIVELLINCGADVNAKAEYGWTALMSAAKEGHTEIVKLLVDAGADSSLRNTNGISALNLAEKYGHKETADLLKKD